MIRNKTYLLKIWSGLCWHSICWFRLRLDLVWVDDLTEVHHSNIIWNRCSSRAPWLLFFVLFSLFLFRLVHLLSLLFVELFHRDLSLYAFPQDADFLWKIFAISLLIISELAPFSLVRDSCRGQVKPLISIVFSSANHLPELLERQQEPIVVRLVHNNLG